MTAVNSTGAEAVLGPPWGPPDEFDEFRLVREIGAGAMGQVYLAHDTLLDRQVAVKFMQGATDPAARARILDEARAIARLQHPNVVAIYRVAEVDGHPYLVSEYIAGKGLDELTWPVPWRRVLDIAIDLARGLAAAHRRGVLHRDVKPANAILADDGRARLLDFGLATIVDRGPAEDTAATLPPEGAAGASTPTALDLAALMSDSTRSLTVEVASSPVVETRGAVRHVVGTPIYLAPELWRGETATRRSDLYSLGILLYELLTGSAPHRDVGLGELAEAVQYREIPRLGDVAPEVEPALAAIVDRLVERDPRARFPSADALLVALEDSAAPAPAGAPEGNPYRGLAAFEAAHAAVFFGRRIEIRELVDRVRLDPFVVVGGDSGTGKSSLCRAGVLPWLVEHGGWSCVEVVPGRHPVRALAAALAPWTGRDEAALAEQLRDDPDAVARAIRKHAMGRDAAPSKLLVFVDQLEELLTLAARRDAQVVAFAIAALAVRSPSVRVLATARADFLSRLAMLPGLGDEMGRGLYFLRPLGGDQLREAIVRPAAARGVVYESEALLEELVAHVEDAPGGLPVLQFTLAELWDARDALGRTIRAEALAARGGVAGALARHADRVLAGLRSHERDAARRILLRLVTAQGTRARQLEAELLSDGAERTALEALIRGRVVVASNAQDGAYELAHEALVTGWSTLQGWLTQDAADHAVRERVAQAAAEWDRIGRGRDLLWGRRQLAEARALDRAGLSPREAGFLAASASALRTRRVAGAGGVAVLVVGAVIAGLAIRAHARRELEAMVADQVAAAMTAESAARQLAAQRDVARDRAFGLFDAGRWSEGEQAWREVEAMESHEERRYRSASEALDSVLLLDPARAGLRAWAADLTFERLARAERDHRRELAEELASRLMAYDDGRYRAALAADARIELTVAPAGTQVWIERPGTARQRIDRLLPTLHLPTGSLVLAFEAPGYAPARLPVVLARGETLVVRIALPAASSVPPGMIYVPPGRFLFGGAEGSDAARQVFNAAPLHEVTTPGYFIGRYEVTFAEWIEYLDELAPDERRRRTPRSDNVVTAVTALALVEIGGGRWRLSLKPTTQTYTAETGQRLHYEHRAKRADQDWTRFPVSGVSYEDAAAFASWLDRTHRIPGARLCSEYEWERAARGADARASSDGDAVDPDDANVDMTYGREPLAFGPDEVGSHPGSRSPVGADDMAGNVWEWTRSVEDRDEPVLRGGSWYQGVLSARSMNREPGERSLRGILIGLRLCATPP